MRGVIKRSDGRALFFAATPHAAIPFSERIHEKRYSRNRKRWQDELPGKAAGVPRPGSGAVLKTAAGCAN